MIRLSQRANRAFACCRTEAALEAVAEEWHPSAPRGTEKAMVVALMVGEIGFQCHRCGMVFCGPPRRLWSNGSLVRTFCGGCG